MFFFAKCLFLDNSIETPASLLNCTDLLTEESSKANQYVRAATLLIWWVYGGVAILPPWNRLAKKYHPHIQQKIDLTIFKGLKAWVPQFEYLPNAPAVPSHCQLSTRLPSKHGPAHYCWPMTHHNEPACSEAFHKPIGQRFRERRPASNMD